MGRDDLAPSLQFTLDDATDGIVAVTFSPDSKLLSTTSQDKKAAAMTTLSDA